MTREFILGLLEEIEREKHRAGELPGNACFLGRDRVLCLDRERGESRFPYIEDGLVVWLHTTGFIDACESVFTIFRQSNFGEGPHVAFFGGVKGEDGYFPVSVTGAARQLLEKGVSRYTVFTLKCAYCIADAGGVVFALRVSLDKQKHIRFTLAAVNKTDKTADVYLSSFMEALLRYAESETYWQKMTKYGRRLDNGNFILKSINREEDCLVIKRDLHGCKIEKEYFTTSRKSYLGGSGRSLENAEPLKQGAIKEEKDATATTDLPVAANLVASVLPPCGALFEDFELTVCRGESEACRIASETLDFASFERELEEASAAEAAEYDRLKMTFDGWKDGKVKSEVMNDFVRFVQKQTSFCALGKNYGGMYLGFRDVFQQLEGSLMWQREKTRERMVYALNFILSSGRPPRMFSFPKEGQENIPVDLEKYIDQGCWIISTFYTYLAHTGDFSILNEECGYIEAPDIDWCDARFTGECTTVLEHLTRIMEFLISNIDNEYTGCLRVLFGDWNDAVDGLGATEDEGREFGTGVTVMATLQLRQNLYEMAEIFDKVGDPSGLSKRYRAIASSVERGLDKHAIDTDGSRRRIILCWGDKVSYKVGSFCDPDGISRSSLTPNAFWAITGFIERDPSLKREIVQCVDAVSSKYGLKTFDVPFSPASRGVGRIKEIVPGTYENACAYVHCSLFGTMALFAVGESERAWEEFERSIVITHENATLTSFVMPNSYCENPDYCIDGESLSDWHTGSGCVLVKELVRYGFGIYPTLEGLKVQTPKYFPAKRGEIEIMIGDAEVTLVFSDKGQGERTISVDGAPFEKGYDKLMDIPTAFIRREALNGKITVNVTD